TPEGTVSMTIPAGSNSGKVLRLNGRGAFVGGKRGDLLAKLMIQLPDSPDENLTKLAQEMRDRGAIGPCADEWPASPITSRSGDAHIPGQPRSDPAGRARRSGTNCWAAASARPK